MIRIRVLIFSPTNARAETVSREADFFAKRIAKPLPSCASIVFSSEDAKGTLNTITRADGEPLFIRRDLGELENPDTDAWERTFATKYVPGEYG